MRETSDNVSFRSHARLTYVLLFTGSDREMRAYTGKMGIDT